MHDLPEIRLLVRELKAGGSVLRSRESRVNWGSFPVGVEAPVQYGPKMRALAVYLHEYQLVPLGRVSELRAFLCACEVSEGTVLMWVELAAERLAPVVAQIADPLEREPVAACGRNGCAHRRQTATSCMSIARTFSRIWPGMPGEADKR